MSRLKRALLRGYVPARTARWPQRSHLFVVGDDVGWAIDEESARLTGTARRLAYDVAPPTWAPFADGQAYFHGRPGTAGYPEFDEAYETLRRRSARIDRVQVTHDEMQELVLAAGVDPAKVFRIPIGVDLDRFPLGDASARAAARRELGVPDTAFVVGSFQKDGVGWGEGNEPKQIKAPDILVATLEQLRTDIPELVVLLTGPARGYVRSELERGGIPYRHVQLSRDRLALAYHALDVYLVTSRQEGGPKSVLESMAAGVPLVTTRVGQAPTLVEDDVNGLLADVDHVDALAAAVRRVYGDEQLATRLRLGGRPTAEANADERLDPLWAELLDGFVEKDGLHAH